MNSIKYDNIVIGGGLSGLLNALFTKATGKRVLLITSGAGSLTIGSGLIDVLGYSSAGGILETPFDGFSDLNHDHPYRRCNEEVISKSFEVFLNICKEYKYPYLSAKNNRWVPTSLGRLTPSYLVPETMDIESVKKADTIWVVGIDGMKDFSPKIICDSFSNMDFFKDKKFMPLSIPLRQQGFRDFNSMDTASFMDRDDGVSRFIGMLKSKVSKGQGIIIPPILGSMPNYNVYNRIKDELSVEVCETIVIPPAVTGFRLRSLLLTALKNLGVDIIENATVTRGEVKQGRCLHINTLSSVGDRSYFADNFTIATGGFYGRGILSDTERAWESIFNLEIDTDKDWGSPNYEESQQYSKYGVRVNNNLNPCDITGKVILDNVYFIGRVLAGAGCPYEHSGNGVALVTSYLAASII